MAGTPGTKQRRNPTNVIGQRAEDLRKWKKKTEKEPRRSCFTRFLLFGGFSIHAVPRESFIVEHTKKQVPFRVMFHGRKRTTGSPLLCILVGVVARPVPRSRVNSDRAAEQQPGFFVFDAASGLLIRVNGGSQSMGVPSLSCIHNAYRRHPCRSIPREIDRLVASACAARRTCLSFVTGKSDNFPRKPSKI